MDKWSETKPIWVLGEQLPPRQELGKGKCVCLMNAQCHGRNKVRLSSAALILMAAKNLPQAWDLLPHPGGACCAPCSQASRENPLGCSITGSPALGPAALAPSISSGPKTASKCQLHLEKEQRTRAELEEEEGIVFRRCNKVKQ